MPWLLTRLKFRAARLLPEPLRPYVPHSRDYVHLGTPILLSHPLFQISDADIEASRRSEHDRVEDPRSVTWFVPWFRHPAFGGIQTIFRFIDGFAARGLQTRIVIYDNKHADPKKLKAKVVEAFPRLETAELTVFDIDRDGVEDLPGTDIGICTFWASAYLLLRFNQTKFKCYFVQDYEPLFYPAGSTFALAESTYRFGFTGLANTPGLLAAVKHRHGLDGVSFVPAVDARRYYPGPPGSRPKRLRIFFYARPIHPRNAFELGIIIIRSLLERYGDSIEVVAAGGSWNEAEYGLGGRVTNLGLLKSLDEVGELYRSCDIGFVYMLSKHPSYQPFEFMASGMATVTNRNEDNLWFLKDEENCLVAEPSPAAMARQIGRLIDDPELRARIQAGGLASVRDEWDTEVQRVWTGLKDRMRASRATS